jgi:hypothetical protein
MTLSELLTILERRNVLSATRVKDYRTSLRYLAQALGYASADTCPVDDACREQDTWGAALEAHWQRVDAQRALMPPHTKTTKPVGASTRRNTRSDLSKVFHLAETHGLLPAPLVVPLLARQNRRDFERQQADTSPYRHTSMLPHTQPYGLRQAQWPADVQAGWAKYQAAATDPTRPRRRAGSGGPLRQRTLRTYVIVLESYLGYLAHIVGRTPVWEDVFDVQQLDGFVRWHAARMRRPLTTHARQMVIFAAAAAVVLKLKRTRVRALADYSNTLPKPPPMHPKRPFDITLAMVDAAANAWLTEARIPLAPSHDLHHPGARRACRFQRGLLLKLLIHTTLRHRNLREMRLHHNLYADPETGHWHLRFIGPELKIEKRGGQFNEYAKDLTENAPDLIPLINEWLTTFRPCLPNADTSDLCFLSVSGKPHDKNLGTELAYAVSSRTGKRFYPHLIRSMWANEAIRAGAEPGTVAVQLGDTIQTTMTSYYSVDPQTHHKNAASFLARALKQG